MAESAILALAFAGNFVGMTYLALAMKPHWDQTRAPDSYPAGRARTLRRSGGVAFGISLVLCALADHASMAALVWVMTLTAAALAVTFTLAYRPRWLAFLVSWLRTP
jgi:hypothetical protein